MELLIVFCCCDVYFYNKNLGISQFEVPKAVDSPPLPPPPHRSQWQGAPSEPIRQPAMLVTNAPGATSSAVVTATPVPERGRIAQSIRLRAMIPYLDGESRAHVAGELAVLDYLSRN